MTPTESGPDWSDGSVNAQLEAAWQALRAPKTPATTALGTKAVDILFAMTPKPAALAETQIDPVSATWLAPSSLRALVVWALCVSQAARSCACQSKKNGRHRLAASALQACWRSHPAPSCQGCGAMLSQVEVGPSRASSEVLDMCQTDRSLTHDQTCL